MTIKGAGINTNLGQDTTPFQSSVYGPVGKGITVRRCTKGAHELKSVKALRNQEKEARLRQNRVSQPSSSALHCLGQSPHSPIRRDPKPLRTACQGELRSVPWRKFSRKPCWARKPQKPRKSRTLRFRPCTARIQQSGSASLTGSGPRATDSPRHRGGRWES